MDDLVNLQLKLTSALMVAGRQWRHISEQASTPSGLSAACTAPLIFIGRLGEGVRQNVLAEHVGIEGASLVRLLDQLCRAGLIRREVDAADRRANTLWFDGQGKALADKIEADLIELRTQVFANVSQSDIEAALRVLAAIDKAVNPGAPGASAEAPADS